MLGDYRFGNYALLDGGDDPPSCRTLNVSRSMCNVNDGDMVRRAVSALSNIARLPGVKVVPWDLAVREASGSDFSKHGGSSAQIMERFSAVLDVESALKSTGHRSILDLVTDRGGHPSLSGLRFIMSELVWSGSPPPTPTLTNLLLDSKSVFRAVIMLYCRAVRSLVVPLQRRLAVVRPRRKYRGHR